MSKKQRNARTGWNLLLVSLLVSHLFIYLIAWFLALIALINLFSVDHDPTLAKFAAVVLLWLPILALHVIAHISSGRQIRSLEKEREGYREGFADAVRQLVNRQDVVERLALDDEDELFELLEKPKRDYSS